MAKPKNSESSQSAPTIEEGGDDRGYREVTPQARGKAAAWDRWVAQGGELKTRSRTSNSGRTVTSDAKFKKGPMKGLTIDQARQKFATMWDTAPEDVREKYATRARRGATKSEVAEAEAINSRRRVAQPPAPAAAPVQVVAPSRALEDFNDITKAPVAPGGEAQSVGNGATAANGYQPSLSGKAPPGVRPSLVPPPPVVITPQDAAAQNSILSYIGNKAIVVPGKEAVDVPAQAPAVVAPPAQVAAPSVQPVAPAAQVVGPPRSAMPAPEMTGAAVLPTPMGEIKDSAGKITKVRMDPAIQSDNGAGLTRVNRLTGLPFVHAPGDTLPKSGDQAMQQRAGESIQRQASATPIAPANQVVAPVRPATPGRVANDPNIIAKDNAAQAAYQSSLSGGTSDADHLKATRGTNDIYAAATSEDKARLVANTLQRNKALPTTTTPISSATPRVVPVRKPLFASARR